MILKNKKYEKQIIDTGIEYDGWVEIESGLGAGDHVFIEK
jgi:multidrug efflux pump subunit AcrA (membrane-fusion protein)